MGGLCDEAVVSKPRAPDSPGERRETRASPVTADAQWCSSCRTTPVQVDQERKMITKRPDGSPTSPTGKPWHVVLPDSWKVPEADSRGRRKGMKNRPPTPAVPFVPGWWTSPSYVTDERQDDTPHPRLREEKKKQLFSGHFGHAVRDLHAPRAHRAPVMGPHRTGTCRRGKERRRREFRSISYLAPVFCAAREHGWLRSTASRSGTSGRRPDGRKKKKGETRGEGYARCAEPDSRLSSCRRERRRSRGWRFRPATLSSSSTSPRRAVLKEGKERERRRKG